MQERRKTLRRRTCLAGRIEIEKLNGWAVDCAVRNLSEAGARLAIAGDVVVPPTFEMRISGAPAAPARLVWYRGGEVGVALDAATRPTTQEPGNIFELRDVAERVRLAARIAVVASRAPGRGAPRP